MKLREMMDRTMLVALLTLGGCQLAQIQGIVEGVDLSGSPQTRGRYWISVTGRAMGVADYQEHVERAERKLPEVFEEGGLRVIVDLRQTAEDLSKAKGESTSFWTYLGCLSLGILPMYQYSYKSMTVTVSLPSVNLPQVSFSSSVEYDYALSMFTPLAYLCPMSDVKDERFVQRTDGTNGRSIYDHEACMAPDRVICGDAGALVCAVAHVLCRLEREHPAVLYPVRHPSVKAGRRKSVIIGD